MLHPDLLSDCLDRSELAIARLTCEGHPELAAAERAYREAWAERVAAGSAVRFDRVPCECGCGVEPLRARIAPIGTWDDEL